MTDSAELLTAEKRALRRLMEERRGAFAPEERARRSAAGCERLQSLAQFARAELVAGFVSFRSEIDPGAALESVRRRDGTVVLPRVTRDCSPRLRFLNARSPSDLQPGAFGVVEPDADCPEVPIEEIAVLVVPGLAFDSAGRRLGYGGGYYDEVATRVRAAGRGLLVGFGFEIQVVDRCPAGSRDVVIDYVITDERVIRCCGGTT